MKRGFVLIASIFLVLFLGIFLSISLLRSNLQLRAIDLRRDSLSAFYAAEAGIDDAIKQLRQDITWNAGFTDKSLVWKEGQPGQEIVGTYSVQVTDGGLLGNLPTLWLDSQGQDTQGRVTRSIQARVAIENPASFFTSTISDLRLGSGATIGGNLLARDVIFEVNKSLPAAQRIITVNGDVEYIRNIAGYPDADGDVIINGSVTQRAPLTFVGVDLEKYRDLADPGRGKGGNGRYETGNLTISGTIDWVSLGTANGIVFAEGDIYISGTVAESIHIISAGNIYINGDIDCPAVGGTEPQIGLSAAQDVIIPLSAPPTLSIDAFIIADAGVFEAEGAAASKTQLNFEGVITVRGKDTERTGINLNAYTIRNYTYDSALNTSPTIPYTSYLVNLISWQEIKK